MKKTLTRSTVLALALAAPSVLFAGPLFIENPREAMPGLVMPMTTQMANTQAAVIDSDPRSRGALTARIKSHNLLEWEDLGHANRIHFSFKKGEVRLDGRQVESLKQFLEASADKNKIIVYGFCDKEGDHATNKRLSEGRAESVEMLINMAKTNPDLSIVTLSSTLWPGDPADARRVDVLAY